MRSGIDDALRFVHVRQVDIAWIAIEGEMEHRHPWISEPPPQRDDVWRNQAKIFDDDLNRSEHARNRVENGLSRSPGPETTCRRRLSRRHAPGGGESTKVVDPDDIDQPECGRDTIDPPGVPRLSIGRPVEHRVAPELSVGGEVIGWHAGNDSGLTEFVKFEQLAISPDIGAVERDE